MKWRRRLSGYYAAPRSGNNMLAALRRCRIDVAGPSPHDSGVHSGEMAMRPPERGRAILIELEVKLKAVTVGSRQLKRSNHR